MRRHWLPASTGLLVAALAVAAIACGGGKKGTSPTATVGNKTPAVTGGTPSGTQSEVAVTLVEYKIVPQPTSVPAGSITFNARNIGATNHDLAIIKTDLAPDALPTKDDGSVDESATGLTLVNRITALPAQQAKSLALNLEPGKYVLICNVVQQANGQTISHYQNGQRVAFEVTQ